MTEAPLRECKRCGERKPATLEYFNAHKGGKYGLNSKCRICTNALAAERRNDPTKREHDKHLLRDRFHERYLDPEFREIHYSRVRNPKGNVIVEWCRREREGVRMTALQYSVLEDMRIAMEADFPLVYFGKVHHLTRNYLIKQGWVRKSPGWGIDRDRFEITFKGLEALQDFGKPIPWRYDGMCPACGIKERHISGNGHQEAYCHECCKLMSKRSGLRKALLKRVRND